MVEVFGIDRLGKLHRITCAVHVDRHLAFLIRVQVVYRSQVVDEVHGAFELADVFTANAEFLVLQVAKHRNGPGRPHAPVGTQVGDLVGTFLAHQEMHHSAFALQQFFDETFTDEACGPGHKIMHEILQMNRRFLPEAPVRGFSTNPC